MLGARAPIPSQITCRNSEAPSAGMPAPSDGKTLLIWLFLSFLLFSSLFSFSPLSPNCQLRREIKRHTREYHRPSVDRKNKRRRGKSAAINKNSRWINVGGGGGRGWRRRWQETKLFSFDHQTVRKCRRPLDAGAGVDYLCCVALWRHRRLTCLAFNGRITATTEWICRPILLLFLSKYVCYY